MDNNYYEADYDPQTGLYAIVKRGEQGAIPKVLQGKYNDRRLAQSAVKLYLAKKSQTVVKPKKKQVEE